MDATSAIEVSALSRRYGEKTAVDRISFTVARGEVFGFLGPNGAGKSTTTRMLTGYLTPSSGVVRVAGCDMTRDPVAARAHIGVVPEEANVYADLTVWQNVMLMAELHGVPRRIRESRADELLSMFAMSDRKQQKGRQLSKGLRQRLMICAALVSEPQILFLDEPTSGLDVASAHLIRDIVRRMNREKAMTVFITTHNMDEAGDLCHRIAIIDKGRLAVVDTPQNLRGTLDARRSVEVRFIGAKASASELLSGIETTEVVEITDGYRIYTSQPGALAQRIANLSSERGLQIASLNTLAPTLEDVFLHITKGLAKSQELSDAHAR